MKASDPSITNASALVGTEYWAGVQGGADARITAQQVATLAASSGAVQSSNFRVPGNYVVQAVNAGQSSSYTAANGSLRAFPFVVTKAMTFTEIKIRVSTFLASGKMRIAVYADNGSGYPGNMVAGTDTGEFNVDTPNGTKVSSAVSITLNPGLYWVASNANGTVVLDAYTSDSGPNVMGVNDIISGGAPNNRWLIAQTYGAMPDPFPAGAAQGSAAFPVVGFKV